MILDRVLPCLALPVLLAFVSLVGCGDDENDFATAPPSQPNSPAPQAPEPGRRAADAGADATALPALPVREFQESDFTETDQNRDPFRSFARMFATQAKAKPRVQRPVVIERFALDELKLVGIVTRASARALFVDPNGVGWVTKIGDFVGKAEIVRSGGQNGHDVPINWRIDRIRDGDVVFVREDPAHPDIPPVTRVIALRPESTDDQSKLRR